MICSKNVGILLLISIFRVCWTGGNTALVFHSLTCASTQMPQVVNVEAGKNKGRTGSLEIY